MNRTLKTLTIGILHCSYQTKDDWLFGKIIGSLRFNNSKEGYGFDVHGPETTQCNGISEPDVHPKGKPEDMIEIWMWGPGSLIWEISYSILLNPGCKEVENFVSTLVEIQIHIQAKLVKEAMGNVVMFPSYMVHRVTPMVKGTR